MDRGYSYYGEVRLVHMCIDDSLLKEKPVGNNERKPYWGQ